jgi:Ca2+-binding EF-hand superfamily protein
MSGEGEGEIPANVLQALRSTFAKFDEDGKGSLDREQFQRMVQSKGPTTGDELYNFFDHDEEGTFSMSLFDLQRAL